MTTAWRDPSMTPFENAECVSIVERCTPLRPIKTREEFRRWLKRVLHVFADSPSDRSTARGVSAFEPQIWKIAVDCVERFCPEYRSEMETIARMKSQSADNSEETRKSSEAFLARLRALYAVTASPAEADADRLEQYLHNFSSRGQKAMVTELWTKGSASYQRLATLRGTYGVTANADRNAIDRLVAKAESLWTSDRQICIKKCRSGLTLEKHPLDQVGAETHPPAVNKSS
jgi:hypothetical protein